MKLVLAGGSGHVGNLLARSFHGGGDEVVVLSRQPAGRPWRVVAWDAWTAGAWAAELRSPKHGSARSRRPRLRAPGGWPEPLPYAAFLRILRESWGAPWGLPAARWMLAIGAFVLRTETELVLKSRRVVPARLLQSGFTFLSPAWPEAARDLCARWRDDRKRRRAELRYPGA